MAKSHGLVFDRHDADYSGLTKFGEVKIAVHPMEGVRIEVIGFEFQHGGSCRQVTTKAVAWAREVLDTAVRADKLVPGGTITTVAEQAA